MQFLKTYIVALKNVCDEVKLSGQLGFDENKVVKVYPFSSGNVLNVNVSVGDYVKAGQVLATIKIADVADNYADLSDAGNDVVIAKRAMESAEHPFKSSIASDYIEVKENYNKVVVNANKIREQIQINGGGHCIILG